MDPPSAGTLFAVRGRAQDRGAEEGAGRCGEMGSGPCAGSAGARVGMRLAGIGLRRVYDGGAPGLLLPASCRGEGPKATGTLLAPGRAAAPAGEDAAWAQGDPKRKTPGAAAFGGGTRGLALPAPGGVLPTGRDSRPKAGRPGKSRAAAGDVYGGAHSGPWWQPVN